jgi:hypothetical protein
MFCPKLYGGAKSMLSVLKRVKTLYFTECATSTFEQVKY